MNASPIDGLLAANIGVALAATMLALWLRPWRVVGLGGPPWPWLALCVLMPLLWCLDRQSHSAVAQPLSGAPLLVLFAGWPLAILALLPVTAAAVLFGDLSGVDALQRMVWLGVVPATLTLIIGASLRRWLPHHLFVYILGRGFFGTVAACALAGVATVWLRGAASGNSAAELAVAHLLAAFAEGFLTGMLTAISVAFRPQWLCTYSDRLYLPPKP